MNLESLLTIPQTSAHAIFKPCEGVLGSRQKENLINNLSHKTQKKSEVIEMRCKSCGHETKEEGFSEIVFKAGKRAAENAKKGKTSREPIMEEGFVWD